MGGTNIRLRGRRVSYAACVSIAAIILATTSGALAAVKAKAKPKTYSGASIVNNTLTGSQVKNRSLATSDLGFGRVGAAGAAGPQGATGLVGDRGPTGLQGTKGEAGADAARQFSYSYRDTAGRFSSITNPNSGSEAWWLRSSVSAYTSPNFITASGLTMTDLGQAQNSGGVLNLTRTSDVTVNATITLLHRGDPRCADGTGATQMDDPENACGGFMGPSVTASEADDVNTFTRAECWTMYANANGSSATRIGESVYVSGSFTEQLVNVPVTAGITLQPGSYTFRTTCRLADRTPRAQLDDWEFVHANMSVLAAADSLGS